MDMYNARVLRGQFPQPNFPTPPGSGPSRSEHNTTTVQQEESEVAHSGFSRQPRRLREERKEDCSHADTQNTSVHTPSNQPPVADLGDQFFGSNRNYGTFPAVPSGVEDSMAPPGPRQPRKLAGQRKEDLRVVHVDAPDAAYTPPDQREGSFAPSGPSRQPRKPTEQRKEDLARVDAQSVAYTPDQHSVVDRGDEFPGSSGDCNPPPAAPGGVQGVTSSGPSRQPRKPAEQRKEEFQDLHVTGTGTYTNPPPQYEVLDIPDTGGIRTATQAEEGSEGYAPNIVILGETGVEKSSVINLIADQKFARTSNDALRCAFQHKRYPIKLGRTSCILWDTDITGLDEAPEGSVPAKRTETNLKQLIQELARSGGIHLVIYCTRGTQLTRALKRNYDLFYVTMCQKKVHVALVVTGLEYEKGEMEKWWTMNEAVLRRNGMRFDAHACVATLDIDDHVIQQRRFASQSLLRELAVKYSELPALKIDQSPLSRVLSMPSLHSIICGTSSTGSPGKTATTRKVAVCGSFNDFLPGVTAVGNKSMGAIGDNQYEFLHLDKHALHKVTPRTLEDIGEVGVGLLVFYTAALINNRISSADVDALRKFYDVAGGHTCPVIVVLRGCNDEEAAWTCKVDVALRHNDIQAHFFPLPGTDRARAKLDELIEGLCIERAEVRKPLKFFEKYKPFK